MVACGVVSGAAFYFAAHPPALPKLFQQRCFKIDALTKRALYPFRRVAMGFNRCEDRIGDSVLGHDFASLIVYAKKH
jgi:hypothetical protein